MKSKAKLLESRRSSYRTSKNVLVSFRYAFNGIKYTFENSRNFKIQVLFALFILIIGSILQLDKSDYLIMLGTIFSVLTLEIINLSLIHI